MAATARVEDLPDAPSYKGAWSVLSVSIEPNAEHNFAADDAWSTAGDSDYTALMEVSDVQSAGSMPGPTTPTAPLDGSASGREATGEIDETFELLPAQERARNVTSWLLDVSGCELSPGPEATRTMAVGLAALSPLAAAVAIPHQVVDLYDSGATHHMCPYREDFLTFTATPDKPFVAELGSTRPVTCY
ncbi:hypothetical protein C8Q77DRAFT_1156441 [Trametes polyzona]|nr:hypothetical protein C8Q77DRAFT_1156441 [Trametes polyzona]